LYVNNKGTVAVNIFGVGGAELVLIFIIMLVVAGPKRMLRWAYLFGKFAAQLRVIWDNVMEIVQKEVEAAGMDVDIPRELPTRNNVTKWFNEQTRDVTAPLQKDIDRVDGTLKQAQRDLGAWNKPGNSTQENNPAVSSDENGGSVEPSRQASRRVESHAGDAAFGSWTASDNGGTGSDAGNGADDSGFGAWEQPRHPGNHASQQAQQHNEQGE
jgi:Sec-independent protein translocase protein TatA